MRLMTRLGAIALVAAACEFALPKGNLKSSAKKAMSLMVLVNTIECVVELIGEM